jgi:hypothetical protein
MEGTRSPLNSLSSAIGEYLSLRTDDFKKNVVTGLSIGFSRVLSILVMVMLLIVVLAIFALAFIILLGEAIGSLSGAAFIVGGVYLIALAVLFLLRKRLFLNMFTNLFTGIIDSGTSSDKWKTMALVAVRYLRGLTGE